MMQSPVCCILASHAHSGNLHLPADALEAGHRLPKTSVLLKSWFATVRGFAVMASCYKAKSHLEKLPS